MARSADTRRCGVMKRSTPPEPCENPAGFQTEHAGFGPCHVHGGNSQNGRLAAVQDQITTEAKTQLGRLGHAEPVDDPLTKLSEIAGEAVMWKDIMAERIMELQDDEWRYQDAKGAEQLRSEVLLWERAIDRCERFLTAMARLRIDERLAKISEVQAAIVTKAIVLTMAEIGLNREQQEEARQVVIRHLRAIDSRKSA